MPVVKQHRRDGQALAWASTAATATSPAPLANVASGPAGGSTWRGGCSKHVADVGTGRGIGVVHVFQVAGGEAFADGEPEEVDDLLGVVAEEVGAEDPAGAFLDEGLEAGVSEGDPPRRVPAGCVVVADGAVDATCLGGGFVDADPGECGSGVDHTGDAGVVGGAGVAFEEVGGHDAALHARHGREREAAARDG